MIFIIPLLDRDFLNAGTEGGHVPTSDPIHPSKLRTRLTKSSRCAKPAKSRLAGIHQKFSIKSRRPSECRLRETLELATFILQHLDDDFMHEYKEESNVPKRTNSPSYKMSISPVIGGGCDTLRSANIINARTRSTESGMCDISIVNTSLKLTHYRERNYKYHFDYVMSSLLRLELNQARIEPNSIRLVSRVRLTPLQPNAQLGFAVSRCSSLIRAQVGIESGCAE